MFHKRFVLPVLGLGFLLGLPSGSGAQAPAKSGKIVTLTEAPSGRTVRLHIGDILQIRLDSNVTTGYHWSVTKGVPPLQETDEDVYETSEPMGEKRQPSGRGGTQLFKFKALKAGTTTLKLDYARRFEKNTQPIRTWKATVVTTAK